MSKWCFVALIVSTKNGQSKISVSPANSNVAIFIFKLSEIFVHTRMHSFENEDS